MYNNYKDASPDKTIERIKCIFDNLYISVEEDWFESFDGLYSLQLVIDKTPLYSNGKGISRKLARASAYAELIERIQSGIIFRLLDNYNLILKEDKDIHAKSNILKPEKIMDYISTYLDLHETIDKNKKIDILNLLSTTIKYFNFQETIVYKNTKGEEICIPSLISDLYYGSNGLAAGNTKHEAITQALYEIMERYTIKKVLEGELEHYSNITSYVKETLKVFNKQIKKIEKSGFIIKFLDMSIETNLPVVMLVLIDCKRKKYFVNCASHSSLILAIEHSLTETFQGRSLDDISDSMTPITASCKNKFRDNLISVFINGEGIYPANLLNFKQMATHLGHVWDEFESNINNKQISEIIIKKIEDKGFPIYISDLSSCGFPTYHIIIPGMSEVTDIMDISILEKLNYTEKIKLILNKKNPSENEIVELINYFTTYEYPENYTLKDFYKLPLTNESYTALDALDINLLLSIAYGYIEDFNNATINIHKYNQKLSIMCDDENIINYYIIIENVFNLLSLNKTNADIVSILSTFFKEKIIEEVLSDISKENILKTLPKINCFNQKSCHSCDINKVCSFNTISKIIDRVKTNQLNN